MITGRLLHPLAGKTFPRLPSPPFVFPSAANTGPRAGTTLVNVPGTISSGPGWSFASGSLNVTGSHVTLRGLNIAGQVNLTLASNVTLTDCVITNNSGGGSAWGIGLHHCTNVRIQYCQISSDTNQGATRLLVGCKDINTDSINTVIAYCNIFNASTGIQGERGTWAYNYVHDLGFTTGDHLNGCTSNGGAVDPLNQLNIMYNTFLCATDPSYSAANGGSNTDVAATGGYTQTDGIGLFEDFGVQMNRNIIGNLIGGGSYTLYAGSGSHGATSNIVIMDNYWTTQFFPAGGNLGHGAAWDAGTGDIWSGNTWYDGPNAGLAIAHP